MYCSIDLLEEIIKLAKALGAVEIDWEDLSLYNEDGDIICFIEEINMIEENLN